MNEFTQKRSPSIWKNALGLYVGAALLVLAFFAGAQIGYIRGQRAAVPAGEGRVQNTEQTPPAYLSRDVDFGLYWRVWNVLKDRYIERPVSDTQLFYGSLEGMVDALGDPYTVFLDPETTEKFTEELSGRFDGIGAEIGKKDEILTIIAPLPDTPAERAGIVAGDRILAIDGVDTAGMTVEEAVTRIRGLRGTPVVLTIAREGQETSQDITITRAEITIHSVRSEMRDDGIAVINLYQFGEDTAAEFSQTVQELLVRNPRGIILDLRNNPGGFLDAAVDVAGEWIPAGELVVIEQNDTRSEFRSPGPARLAGIATAVLVNGGSASGAEILAGALQDYDTATLIGTQTFGKGSVQDFQMFDDGSAVKYTIAEWLTPLGRSINQQGIAPDEVVEFTEEDAVAGRDPQLERAVQILQAP